MVFTADRSNAEMNRRHDIRRILRWFVAWLLGVGLLGPIAIPGYSLVELYVSGSTDDYYEFCTEADHPGFILGAAKTCELNLDQLLVFTGMSYLGAVILFAPVITLLLLLFGGKWLPEKERRHDGMTRP